MICRKHGVEHQAFEPCPACVAEIVAMGPETYDALHPSPGYQGVSPPPGGKLAERAIEAIKRAFVEEFAGEQEWPQVTLVVSVPPDGQVVVATTEHDMRFAVQALKMGWGAAHRGVRLRRERSN